MHDVLVRNVAVCKDDLLDLECPNEISQGGFGMDGNTLRIQRPRKSGRVALALEKGNLGNREGDDFTGRVIPVDPVEGVEVAASGTHDDDPSSGHF
jgi:hypothetical protein